MAMQAAELEVPTWTLGDRLRKAREHAGIKREAMAAVFGVTPGAISHWENDRQRPRDLLAVANGWAVETGVPVQWLLGVSTSMYESTPALSLIRGGIPEQLTFDQRSPNFAAAR